MNVCNCIFDFYNILSVFGDICSCVSVHMLLPVKDNITATVNVDIWR